MRKLQTLFVMILVSLAGSPAFAASGGSPNGKPFVEINGQIAEVRGELRSLSERIERLEFRTDSLEAEMSRVELDIQILDLVSQELSAALAATNGDLQAIEDLAAGLKEEILDIEGVLSDLSATDLALEQQLLVLDEVITSLQEVIDYETVSLQEQIDINSQLLAHLNYQMGLIEEQLELKQNMISGECPSGEILVGLEGDSLTCKSADQVIENGGSYWKVYTTTNTNRIRGRWSFTVSAGCNREMSRDGLNQVVTSYQYIRDAFALDGGLETIPYGYKVRGTNSYTDSIFIYLERDYSIAIPNWDEGLVTAWVKCMAVFREDNAPS